MRYFKFYGSTPLDGTDYVKYTMFEDTITDEELCFHSERYSYQNALIYMDCDIYREDYDSYEDFLEALKAAEEEYLNDCSRRWKEITKEEYDEQS